MIAPDWKDYEVIATGDGEKLERWGDIVLLRPDPQAIWKPPFPLATYPGISARYLRPFVKCPALTFLCIMLCTKMH